MLATDFEYDGIKLSDFGFIPCSFDSSSDAEEISMGSIITFNTVAHYSGKKYGLSSTQYDECIECTFSICKDPCENNINDMYITNSELHALMRWLNRREFLPMRFIYDDEDNEDRVTTYYDASFNVDKISQDGKVYGISLTMVTNSPMGYGEEVTVTINVSDTSATYSIEDESEEIGCIYPSVVITCLASGDLVITNETEECSMQILNCSNGEVITIDGDTHIISTSDSGHSICDDFNFDFFKIGNTYDNQINYITASILCTIEITYSPFIKDTPD